MAARIDRRIGFIGGGNMAEAIIRGLLDAGLSLASEILVSDTRRERLTHLCGSFGVEAAESNAACATASDIVILAVNIGQAPETITTQGGTSITRFTMATSRPRYSEGRVLRDENGYRVQDTEWHRITCFNGLGKTVQQHCDKGMKVLVRGRIHYTKWTDAAGVDRYGCEIIAETVDFLSRAKQTQNDDGKFIDDDDIPF